MNLGLGGKRALVTGGSRGIGRACADRLAEEGAHLALVARDLGGLEAAARDIEDRCEVSVTAIPADLTDAAQASGAVGSAVAALGGLDILVNNAGSSVFGDFDQTTDADWAEAFDLKVMGYVRCIRAALPVMRSQRSGVIVNIVGMAGRFASPGYVLGSLNAALLHLTKSVSELVAPDGIRVVAVNPGLTTTERMDDALSVWAASAAQDLDEFRANYLRARVPLGRFTEPGEVAAAVAFLCSETAAPATGSAIQLDGGATKGVF